MCRSSKRGQGERECVWLAFTGRGGHAGSGGEALHTYLCTPRISKQIHTNKSLYITSTYLTLPYNQIFNYFLYIICQKNLTLNIKGTYEHLQRLTQESDRINHDVSMLSTHSV